MLYHRLKWRPEQSCKYLLLHTLRVRPSLPISSPFLAVLLTLTQPDRTLFFLIFAYLWGTSHWSFRNYGSNAAIYNISKPETNKGEFSLYFELFEKKVVGGATTQKSLKQTLNPWFLLYGSAPRGPRGVKRCARVH